MCADFHWLRVPERIMYMLGVLMYNSVFLARRCDRPTRPSFCWSNVAPSTAVCIVIRSCGARLNVTKLELRRRPKLLRTVVQYKIE